MTTEQTEEEVRALTKKTLAEYEHGLDQLVEATKISGRSKEELVQIMILALATLLPPKATIVTLAIAVRRLAKADERVVVE